MKELICGEGTEFPSCVLVAGLIIKLTGNQIKWRKRKFDTCAQEIIDDAQYHNIML